MVELLHGETRWLEGPATLLPSSIRVSGGITSESEEEALEELNRWVLAQGLPQGLLSHEYADPETGDQKAVFDLAWPNGIQEELSQPVAVLLNEPAETLSVASQAGYRFFTQVDDFKRYVQGEILALDVVRSGG